MNDNDNKAGGSLQDSKLVRLGGTILVLAIIAGMVFLIAAGCFWLARRAF